MYGGEYIVECGLLLGYLGEEKDITIPEGIDCISMEPFSERPLERLVLPPTVSEIRESCHAGVSIDRLVVLGDVTVRPEAFFCCDIGALEAPDEVFDKIWAELNERSRYRVAMNELKEDCCHRLTAEFVKENSTRMLTLIREHGGPAAFRSFLGLWKKMRLYQLNRITEAVSDSAEYTALALEYRNGCYTPEELEQFTADCTAKELGLMERTMEDWREIYTMKIDRRGVSITGYLRNESIVTVPARIGRNPVYAVDDYAMRDKSMTLLSVPGSVDRLGHRTFADCGELREVIMGEGVEEISAETFSGCRMLEKISLPRSVRTIGLRAFAECASLTEIDLPERLASLGRGAFSGCTGLKSVRVPGEIIALKSHLFHGCTALEKVVVEEGVTEIQNNAFFGCNALRVVCIPASVRYIGLQAFGRKKEFRIYAPRGSYAEEFAQDNEILYSDGDPADTVWEEPGYEIIGGVLTRCTVRTGELVIPEGVTELSEWMFSDSRWRIQSKCNRLWGVMWDNDTMRVKLPGSLKAIRKSAFNNNRWIREIELPPALEELEDEAFMLCDGLESVHIPPSVKKVGKRCFARCFSLRALTIDRDTEVESGAFSECFNLADRKGFVIVNGVLFAFRGKGEVIIPDGVHTVDREAFRISCPIRVTIPASVKKIAEEAFKECFVLESVTILGDDVEIAPNAFEVCWSLEKIEVTPRMAERLSAMDCRWKDYITVRKNRTEE